MEARLERALSPRLRYHVGHLGVLASIAAFEQGRALAGRAPRPSRRATAGASQAILAGRLPEVGYMPPEAGYLAWLDCRALDLGDDPAAASSSAAASPSAPGPAFGVEGNGFARLNFATSPALLAEAVARMAAGAAPLQLSRARPRPWAGRSASDSAAPTSSDGAGDDERGVDAVAEGG